MIACDENDDKLRLSPTPPPPLLRLRQVCRQQRDEQLGCR